MIKDLKIRQGNVNIAVDIVDVSQVRQFEKFGRHGRVATAIAKDETGDIKLTLWNDDTARVKPGDRIKITNGYVSEWQGEPQLTTGKLGKLEIIDEGKEMKQNIIKKTDGENNKKGYGEAEERLDKIEEEMVD